MLFPFQPLEAEGHVNDVGYESKEKMEVFAIFPKREFKNESVLLCPLPVILCMNEGGNESEEEVTSVLCLYCSVHMCEGSYKGKDAAASVLCL